MLIFSVRLLMWASWSCVRNLWASCLSSSAFRLSSSPCSLYFLRYCLFKPLPQGLLLGDSGDTSLVEYIKVYSNAGIWFYSCPRSTCALSHTQIVTAVIQKSGEANCVIIIAAESGIVASKSVTQRRAT